MKPLLTRLNAGARSRHRVAGAVAGVAVMAIVASVPAPAFAARLGSDRVGGVPAANAGVAGVSMPDFNGSAGVVEKADGTVLWSRAADTRRAMASTTKLMTVLLAIESGDLDKPVYISSAAASTPYGIGLRSGSTITKRRLIDLAVVASSNDAAYALGEATGPGMPAFVGKMNAKAAELGLRNTHFANPHGLDAPGHYSTPSDLATLLRADMKHAAFRKAASLTGVTAPGIGTLAATDKLLRVYPGFEGGKTGTTSDAGACFVGTAKRNGVSLVTVVLNAGGDRFTETKRLLDWGFKHTGVRKLAKAGAPAGKVRVSGTAVSVPVVVKADAKTVYFDLAGVVRSTFRPSGKVALPLYKGQPIGTVTFAQGSRVLAQVPAIAGMSLGSANETVGAVPVSDYLGKTVAVRAGKAPVVPAFDPKVPVTRDIVLPATVPAPVTAGQTVGTIAYSQHGKMLFTVPAVAATSVERPLPLEVFEASLVNGFRALVGAPAL